MRIFVTGASGFVGRWLVRELQQAGHAIVDPDARVDVTDRAEVREALRSAAPDAVVHLAAISYSPDATADPAVAFDVNVRGTLNVVESVRLDRPQAAVLVAGSSEVYQEPDGRNPVLHEDAPLAPRNVYGLSKAGAEAVALALAAQHGLRVAVARAFNHIGPGQREVFVVPAIARRVARVAAGEEPDVPIGNADVRRDFTDVRDVALAYRLILEALEAGRAKPGGVVLNVASGRSTSIAEVVAFLAQVAGIEPRIRVDPALVRQGEAAEIIGDASRLTQLTGWRASTPIETTLADVWEEQGPARAAHRPP